MRKNHLYQIVKLFLQRKTSPGYKLKGSCEKCGKCCRNITLKIEDDFIFNETQFETLKKWQNHYENFFITGKDEEGMLLFTCRFLAADNKCKVHWRRSLFCRNYPRLRNNISLDSTQMFDGCGYYFEASESFSEIFNKTKEGR